MAAEETINQQGEDTNPTLDDFLPSWDVSTGQTKKVSIGNIRTLMEATRWNPEYLGRTTLASASDTISLTPITARKYLTIYMSLLPSGQIAPRLRFNNDSSASYAVRIAANGGADTTTVSGTTVDLVATETSVMVGNISLVNISTQEKVMILQVVTFGDAGAGTSPTRLEGGAKWANTSNQITRVDVINNGTGDFAAGSEIVAFGHD